MMQQKHKRMGIILGGLLGAFFLLTAGVMQPFASSCQALRGKVLRLHVLADSNDRADQQRKLLVRDAVLQEADHLLASADNQKEAVALARASLPLFQAAADRALLEAGCTDKTSVELCRMYFPKRTYEDGTTLPAGTYDALRVIVGKGEGKNWWCMLFPKLCLSAASLEENKASLSAVFTKEELDIVENSRKYQVRLFLLDAFYALRNRLLDRS